MSSRPCRLPATTRRSGLGSPAVIETMGSLTASPWIYVLVAVSVLLDVFLPVLPSGVLVITGAAAAAAGGPPARVPDVAVLLAVAATA
ncbi:membrane protein, partial [Streptomyces sp. RSD-27]